ncbi:MAG: LamG domain-containing protein [Phycisphaerae bacterium]|nr:LamG domain-containing protein [Phycisphaerae bacterium]
MKKTFFAICLFFFAVCHGSLYAAEPVLWWSFDQNSGSIVKDQASNIEDPIEGNFRYLPGVSGTSIKPDGYTTCITRDTVGKSLIPDSAFTVEAWVAHAAYPWNWVPVIALSTDNSEEGFSFKVGPNGDFSLEGHFAGEWQICTSEKNVMPLRKWTHIAAAFDSKVGIRLYVDGKLTGKLDEKGKITYKSRPQLRGLMNYNAIKPSNIHRQHGTLPGWFSVDGLVDEVKIYDKALSAREIANNYKAYLPVKDPPLKLRQMPSGPKGPGRFGAYYTNLKYYPEWDNLWPVASDPDIVVRFDQSATRMVFWRGSRYSPAWVSENGLWMADQSVELFYGRRSLDKEGCFEHMQDRRCRYSHVRVIENTDARVVVHWRYAPVSAHDHLWKEDPKTTRACWVDEYYYIYPDQMAIRNVSWKTGTARGAGMQFQESLPFTQPGQMVSELVPDGWVTIANLDGETDTLKYCKNPQKRKHPDNLILQRYNFKSENKPSIIFEKGSRMHHVEDRRYKHDADSLDIYGSCNHWPVGQMACDGRTVQAADRPTHACGFPVTGPPLHDKDGRTWWNGLYGMTEMSMDELVYVANGWNNPASLEVKSKGFTSNGYNMGQRAYIIEKENSSDQPLSLTVKASKDSPVYNLAFVIKNWYKDSLTLNLNGKNIKPGKDFRTGVYHTIDGSNVNVWIKTKTTKPISITLQ